MRLLAAKAKVAPNYATSTPRHSRLDSTPADLGLDSEWQLGPDYLKKERKDWPFERKFARKK